jgi:hypothetical protein
MSYCRFSQTSDVYAIRNTDGQWECVGCKLVTEATEVFTDRVAFYNHLFDHLRAKHKVPDSAFTRLAQEVREEVEAVRAKITPEQASEMMAQLATYYGEPVRRISEYCNGFRVWQKAIEAACLRETEEHAKKSLERMRDDIHRVSLHVTKSNLLARLLYDGEELRTEPCPIHKGRWSGCQWGDGECPHCMSGSNVTGWIPNPRK